ncbi:excinuclease ABC subunit UvrA [bacterium]|nr:excinuclease ABC subunit UvrA [bacterium]
MSNASQQQDVLRVRGAREHNLKNIDLTVPRNRLVVFTGVSGSGKSSLAFDTIFAEGQRRYVESLSSYARQFLGQMDKPDVDYIEGLSPAISIDQKSTSHNPRSTVGTVTEIYDYLRLLFARVGTPHCHKCGQTINPQTVEQIVDQVLAWPEGTRFQVLAPIARGRKGEFKKELEAARKEGFVRARIDGEVRDLVEDIALDKQKKHDVAIVIDRLIVKADIQSRLADSVATALKKGEGLVIVQNLGTREAPSEADVLFSEHFACSDCGVSLSEVAPRLFSFNSPFGACQTCLGLGSKQELDPHRVVPDPHKSLAEGAIAPWHRTGNPYYQQLLSALSKAKGFDLKTPWEELSPVVQKTVLYGSDDAIHIDQESWFRPGEWGYTTRYEGVIPQLARRYAESTSDKFKEETEAYMTMRPCEGCEGKRLRPEALAVTVGDRSIAAVTSLSIGRAQAFVTGLVLTERQAIIAQQILKEINARLQFLLDVGLDYLTLDRTANTLSGGEAQRIRLATQIGSGLTGVLYILDEPSIGLHQRDNERLLGTLERLRNLGNTLIVVEHDEDTIRAADYLVDVGPNAGVHGGRIVADGTLEEVMAVEESLTAQYLRGDRAITVPLVRREGNGKAIRLKGAHLNNLQNVSVEIPLGKFVSVTGVSGSGKSTLINEVLMGAIEHTLSKRAFPKGLKAVEGLEHIDKAIVIDQSPIGRTPRSNAATYTGLFDIVREVFAQTNEAKARGYQNGRFSFNVKGGRCEACKGEGMNVIEMHFLPDVYVPCEVCKGKRYNRETLEVRFKGKNIAEVLGMTVGEAVEFFRSIPRALTKLQTLADVGLDYIQLGQPATTLSGGEAQRVKLATELSRRSTGRTLYLLDEPTTGLHFYDVEKLLGVLNRLVEAGNTVLTIEHNLDVIKTSDHVIDLGPEGGDRGGTIVAEGPPEAIAACEASHTGRFLRKLLPEGLDAVIAAASPTPKARAGRKKQPA